MRLKANVFLFAILVLLIPKISSFPSEKLSTNYSYQKQDETIQTILNNEDNIKILKDMIDIINYIDEIYSELYNKLVKGEKLTIFFDPAHGKTADGRWEGEATGRISCTGFPEEYYSIQFSRKLYKLLRKNKFIEIKSTKDYMTAIKGEQEEYNNILFSKTIELAKSENAFLIISQHLNNISSLRKADGIINLNGIHITCDNNDNRYLTYIKGIHEGFLTLYNKYDTSGLSKTIAYKTKEILSEQGIKMNSWEYGAVPDDRFSYFLDFPASVIYEMGFISNPFEEKKLRDPDYQQVIVESQYNAILGSIREVFGIDISGFRARNTDSNKNITTLIKLSRIAIHYLQNDNPVKTIDTISKIENNYKETHPRLIGNFTEIKEKIIKAESYFKKCKTYIRKNQFRVAKHYIKKAIITVDNDSLCSALKTRYIKNAYKDFKIKYKDISKDIIPKIEISHKPKKANLALPVILAIEKDQSLEDAVYNALHPNTENANKLIKKFEQAFKWKKVLAKKYSRKMKRKISYWKWEKEKIHFTEGIYIIKLNKELRVTHSKKVSQVLLDPEKYQNHQYLKNSYFAETKKDKSL